MWAYHSLGNGFWWIVPIVMIGLCLFMMWGGKRWNWKGCMRDWSDPDGATDRRGRSVSDSALEILDRRYALGEIDGSEYEEKKKAITQIRQ